MSLADHPAGGAADGGGPRDPGRLGAADGLALAAAPTFAAMALASALAGSGPLDGLCTAEPGTRQLTGMVPMYALMSAFHATAWLRLLCRRTTG